MRISHWDIMSSHTVRNLALARLRSCSSFPSAKGRLQRTAFLVGASASQPSAAFPCTMSTPLTEPLEALFTYLISKKLVPAPPESISSVPPSPKRARRAHEPSLDVVRAVLSRFRNGASDTELWHAWKFFTRHPGDIVWLRDMDDVSLNGARAFIVGFDDAGRVGVKAVAGHTHILHGRNLAWCPPAPDVEATVAVLARALGDGPARKIVAGIACGRCGKLCDRNGGCQVVAHPQARRMRLVDEIEICTTYDEYTVLRQEFFMCEACGGPFWEEREGEPEPWLCYSGTHTASLLPWLDTRRLVLPEERDLWRDRWDLPPSVYNPKDTRRGRRVTMSAPLLQEELEGLSIQREVSGGKYRKVSDIVVHLDICEGKREIRNLMPDSTDGVCLDTGLPSLEALRITDTTLANVSVKIDAFPMLEKLVSYCPRTVCTSSYSSSLKCLQVYAWHGIENGIEGLLEGLPSLEELLICRFEGKDLAISSISLRHLSISPVTDRNLQLSRLGISPLPIRKLELWVPNLMVLDLALQKDWGEKHIVQELKWLVTHRREKDLPKDHVCPPLFVRRLVSACMHTSLPSAVEKGLLAHPDVTYHPRQRPLPKRGHTWDDCDRPINITFI